MEKAEAKRQRRFDRKSATGEAEPAGDTYEPTDQVDRPDEADEPQEPPADGRVE
jgi:hypothetical protein